jgi:hypothetical protein
MNFLQRLKEPSTYAGLGVLASLFHIKELAMFGAPEIGIALAGLASVFLPEQPK